MKKSSIRGGSRTGSGRKQLWQTKQCTWIVDQFRIELNKAESARTTRAILQKNPIYREIDEYQKENNMMSNSQRRLMLANPDGTRLEDIRLILHGDETCPPAINGPALIRQMSFRQRGAIYDAVAISASEHFGKRISRTQVERALKSWNTYVASLGIE